MAPQVAIKVNCVLSWKLSTITATTKALPLLTSRSPSPELYPVRTTPSMSTNSPTKRPTDKASGSWGKRQLEKSSQRLLTRASRPSKILQDFMFISTKVKREGQIREERKGHSKLPPSVPVSSEKTAADNRDVVVDAVSAPVEHVRETDVVYGTSKSDAPDTRAYVWLVPVYTYDPDEAGTSFNILIQSNSVEGWKDLAKGAGGDYRYVRVVQDSSIAQKAVALTLVRMQDSAPAENILARLGPGWDGARRDINENRGGDYLYFAWQLS
ncbi:hypothetical protein F4776DRAFT_666125 [Hypoxylon sp. NC0597]|nr:hypothetical protein F4776DRAFT_666125 [Hypoxylon sp. NC0597]